MRTPKTLVMSLLAVGVLAACSQKQPVAPSASEPAASAPPTEASAQPAATTTLTDISERDALHVVGISYPPAANRYPALAKVISDYANNARDELNQAVKALGDKKPSAPYELSLAFETVVDTPDVVAISADGETYTGGAHGNPLVARFTWLPKQNSLLTTKDLLPSAKGLQALSNYVREQLHTKLSLSADSDGSGTTPEAHAAWLASGNKMIDDGTTPKVENFSLFQPVLNSDGRITAIRFVFPPYQVGPYSDGTQSVDVPAQVLSPYVAEKYSDLFAK